MPKRALIMLILLAAVAVTPARAATRNSARTESRSYSAPAFGHFIAHVYNGVANEEVAIGGVVFGTSGGERTVEIKIVDAVSPNVSGSVGVDVDGNGVIGEKERKAFCGKPKGDIPLGQGRAVVVWVNAYPCEDGTFAFATTGEVKATFH